MVFVSMVVRYSKISFKWLTYEFQGKLNVKMFNLLHALFEGKVFTLACHITTVGLSLFSHEFLISTENFMKGSLRLWKAGLIV